ncbi:hypothetical protein ACC848_37270, partial [Rhizobium johnstonii]
MAWRVGSSRVDWATASLLTELPGSTLVLVAEAGIEPQVSIDGKVHTGTGIFAGSGGFVLVLPATDAGLLWVRDAPEGRTLLRTAGELSWNSELLLARGDATVELFDTDAGSWRMLTVARADPPVSGAVIPDLIRAARTVPADHGFRDLRHSAPTRAAIDEYAAVFAVALPEAAFSPEADAVLDIDWAGDVGELRVD